MNRLKAYFADYSAHHRTSGNQATHAVGIPMIVVAVLGALGAVPVSGGLTGSELLRVDLGSIAWFITAIWYFTLDWRLAGPFTLLTAACYFLGRSLPLPVHGALFVVGWALQFVGHGVYEKRAPAFFKSMQHLLIGPFWVFSKAVGYEPRA